MEALRERFGLAPQPHALVFGVVSRLSAQKGLHLLPLVLEELPDPVAGPGQVLLARSARFAKGTYSALAGFVEAGETIEECVVREAYEEVGVRIGDLRYYGSQSWPFPNSLMIAFTARWESGQIVPQPDEIEDAQWFDLDALPGIPPRFSISARAESSLARSAAVRRSPFMSAAV